MTTLPLEPWRDMHPLESPVLKIGRAKAHIKTINDYSGKYDALDPHSMIRNLNPAGTFYEYQLKSQFPPFLDFGILIGEFAYQLRSALDQLIFSLSVFPENLSGKDRHKAERASSFPLVLERNDAWLKGQMKYVPDVIFDAVWEIVDSVQPYQRGDMAENDLLSILDEINIRDKHRLLKPAGTLLHFDRAGLAEGIEILVAGTVGDGDVFARVPAHLDPKKEFEPRITSEIKIEIARPAGGVGLTVLGQIYRRICADIFPRFEKFFAPMPPSVQRKVDSFFD